MKSLNIFHPASALQLVRLWRVFEWADKRFVTSSKLRSRSRISAHKFGSGIIGKTASRVRRKTRRMPTSTPATVAGFDVTSAVINNLSSSKFFDNFLYSSSSSLTVNQNLLRCLLIPNWAFPERESKSCLILSTGSAKDSTTKTPEVGNLTGGILN